MTQFLFIHNLQIKVKIYYHFWLCIFNAFYIIFVPFLHFICSFLHFYAFLTINERFISSLIFFS